ncbi:Ribosome-binding factor A [Pseudomonas sp. MM227]|uniref:30S ribosome-binding factor RbfA n=1 Tax=unclassified Pseudomonas TaxID=196821 RepID=UPI000F0308A2|nr:MULTISPECIES: 30S ribosome-binding factor RbfA [unclassified Pseudomonas]MBD8595665.1 30S ribosome-binding factor RbfA [Pseudomonas sp. CFBP 8758]MBD8604954.1 30S ribosome-binding factor RbfA [Pseudomonas sp. CFBP 8771]MBD8625141.1 30S ribosome-binding factor RbfA [Pseudomonas sp. CFBP 13727]MBD8733181.1 30S ribosome-binding factor RbfA [Pseudomonas sp. CFBP 13710]MBD8828859.1 30S ribosome-binding factor RbfA [Pseudomonas sp. CFBP 13602]
MAKEYSRTQRIGDQMQRELAQLIRREVKDPRVGLVTITAVEVSRDVGHAKIFITVMGQDSAADIAQSIKVLNSAAGFLRMQLAKEMKLRSVPQLHFHYDESVSRGAHLSALIERAVAEDSQHHADESAKETKE